MIQKLARGYFHGEKIRSRRLAGLTFTEYLYPGGLRLSKHAHECAYFRFVLRGAFDEACGRRVQACVPSTLTFHPSGEAHTDHFHNRGGHLFSIELESQLVERLRESSISIDNQIDLQGALFGHLVLDIYSEFQESDELSSVSMEGLALELIAESVRHSRRLVESKPQCRIELAREYLREHFSEPVGLTSVARIIDTHPVCLAREFRKRFGCTLGEYVRRLRIEFARRRMATSNEPLAKIALDAGFCDQAHFSKTFKRFTTQTPTEFRTASRHR
jgi:AraC family transcriptional regulator